MPETRKRMIPVRVDFECECGGKMRNDGFVYSTNPPQYPHACKKCGKTDTFERRYPYIDYESADG